MRRNLKGALAVFLFVSVGCFQGAHAASIKNNNKNLNGKVQYRAARQVGLNNNETLTLNKTTDSLTVGEGDKLTASLNNVSMPFVEWISSDPSVVYVEPNGEVTANEAGQATLTAKCGELTASCVVTVKDGTGSKIKLNKIIDILNTGDVDQLSVQATSDNIASEVKWSTTNPSIAKVDANGKVTASGRGTAWITVSYGSKIEGTCMVNVSDGEQFAINKTTETLQVGDMDTLTATLNNKVDRDVTFMTNSSRVATVDGNGKLIATGKGTAVIIAVSKDGTMAACTVTVE
ncbi:Ig domain-containing protein [Clostridium neuense]|uniref:Ig domain-containing protein n=1 Tax=Clostridium neuense TaxID=1728934 RepID=A0ABW8TCU0_9CLOT